MFALGFEIPIHTLGDVHVFLEWMGLKEARASFNYGPIAAQCGFLSCLWSLCMFIKIF